MAPEGAQGMSKRASVVSSPERRSRESEGYPPLRSADSEKGLTPYGGFPLGHQLPAPSEQEMSDLLSVLHERRAMLRYMWSGAVAEPSRGRAISMARAAIDKSMLGSSSLCAVTIDGRNGKWMKPTRIVRPRRASAWSVV
jgi:hypothetical protein